MTVFKECFRQGNGENFTTLTAGDIGVFYETTCIESPRGFGVPITAHQGQTLAYLKKPDMHFSSHGVVLTAEGSVDSCFRVI